MCDSFHASSDCGANTKCCTSQSRPAANGGDQQTSGGQQQQLCRGTCLPVYHSTLCAKPNELVSNSPSCLANQVCCGQHVSLTSILDGNNYIEDGAESSSSPSSASNLDQLLQTTMFPTQQAADGTLVASLVPPPPNSAIGQQSSLSAEQLAEQTGRQRHAQPNQMLPIELQHFQQQFFEPTSRPIAKTAATHFNGGASSTQQNGGFVNQLLQMFKPSNVQDHIVDNTQNLRPALRH